MTIHVNRPSSTRYAARVRAHGCKKYTLVGKPTRSPALAIRRMADAFATGHYKRGDVILTADWYEPHIIVEMVRR